MRHRPGGSGALGGAGRGVLGEVDAGTAGTVDLACLRTTGVAVARGAEARWRWRTAFRRLGTAGVQEDKTKTMGVLAQNV